MDFLHKDRMVSDVSSDINEFGASRTVFRDDGEFVRFEKHPAQVTVLDRIAAVRDKPRQRHVVVGPICEDSGNLCDWHAETLTGRSMLPRRRVQRYQSE